MKNLGIAKLVYTRRVCFRLFFIKPTIFPLKLCKSKFACYAFFMKKKIILDNDSVVVTLRRFIFILYVTHSADGKNCYNFHSTEPPVFLETKKS